MKISTHINCISSNNSIYLQVAKIVTILIRDHYREIKHTFSNLLVFWKLKTWVEICIMDGNILVKFQNSRCERISFSCITEIGNILNNYPSVVLRSYAALII